MQNARAALERIYLALRGIACEVSVEEYENDYTECFVAAMNDDFNVPEVLAVLFDIVKAINACKVSDPAKSAGLAAPLRHLAEPLGVLQLDAEEFLKTLAFNAPSDVIAEPATLSAEKLMKRLKFEYRRASWGVCDWRDWSACTNR